MKYFLEATTFFDMFFNDFLHDFLKSAKLTCLYLSRFWTMGRVVKDEQMLR